MVQVSIHVRPTQGYHYPHKIDLLQIDSAERLESIQEKYATTGSTTRLYIGGQELPLNSSVGSHNLDDYAILECCRSPAMSAALSACLKDLDKIKKLPLIDRTREKLTGILQTPAVVSRDPNHDIWQTKSWNEDSLKSRTINFATMKAVLQRQDRYATHDLPQCNDCQNLFDALDAHNVWKGGGPSKRNFLKQQAHIFKPKKKDGQPSTNWILLEEKLNVQQKVRRECSTALQFDYLEEFVRRDHARHETETRQEHSQQPHDGFDDTSDSHLAHLAASPPRRRGVSLLPRQNGSRVNDGISLARITAPSPKSSRKPYIPQYASGPFSVLATLHLAMQSRHKLSNGRRLLTLTEDQLKRMAQPMCRSNLYDKGRIRGRNAFACMEGLIEKGLVRKEIVRNAETGGEIEKWGLLRDGEVLGELCADFDRAVNHVLPICREKMQNASKNMNLALCLDVREDVHLLKRMKWSCEDEDISFIERELPAGDYLFVDQRNGQEYVLPLVIERKSWSDLADSCLGKGRALNRLDCVKLGSDSECSGNCQLCKMKRCGAQKLMFIVEGERCVGSDGVHRTAKKCTKDKCCSACRLINERHNVTQDVLEGVLDRLQISHGCHIHYTKCYNETIQSLFDIRSLLQTSQSGTFGESLPYDLYASNARRGSTTILQFPLKTTSVQEANAEAIMASVANGEWDLVMVRDLLGVNISGQASRISNYKYSSQPFSSSKQSHHSPAIESKEDDPICIDLSHSVYRSVRTCQHKEKICLDSNSEVESEGERNEAKNMRGGGNPYSSSSDDDINVLPQGNGRLGNAKDNFAERNDSNDDSFTRVSRFDEGRRRKLLERTYEVDSSSDSSIGLIQSSNQRKMSRKKKARRRRTPPRSSTAPRGAKNSATSLNTRGIVSEGSPATPNVAKKISYDVCILSSPDDDSPEKQMTTRKPPSAPGLKTAGEEDSSDVQAVVRGGASDVEVEIVSQIQPLQLSRKRKTSEVPDEEHNSLGNKRAHPILILHGCDEYYQQLYKRLEIVWKDIYSSTADSRQMNDIYTRSVTRLDAVTKESAFPFLRRKTFMKFVLWMQLTVGVQVRLVQRIRFADEIKTWVAYESSAVSSLALSPTPSFRSLTTHPQNNVPYSTPNTSNTPKRAKTQNSADVAHSAPITSNTSKRSRTQSAAPSVNRKRPAMSGDRTRPASTKESNLVRDARLRRFDKPTNQAVSSVGRYQKRCNTWSCPSCTLENSLSDEKCSACGGDSPMNQLRVTGRVHIWSCSSCTFENQSMAENCAICGSSKAAPANSPVACLSSNNIAEHSTLPHSNFKSSKAAPNKRTARCGACGLEGHNRSNATKHTCPAYNDQKEIDRREKIRRKLEVTISVERENIEAIQQESENADRMQAELARQIEELKKNKERAESFRKEELKRRTQKLKRLQNRQNRNEHENNFFDG
mmetsp:Transcript_30118/g.62990  ORF Transcript_30118/g.62990 Transcript_30118/m.62990 type:complete len:1434 (-) Transcript_30118:244-4545(-)